MPKSLYRRRRIVRDKRMPTGRGAGRGETFSLLSA